jgi:hypothetical protein
MMLLGMQPYGLVEPVTDPRKCRLNCSTDACPNFKPDQPTFKVGDRVVRTQIDTDTWYAYRYDGQVGDKGTITEIDSNEDACGLKCRIQWDRIKLTHWSSGGTYKLLPPEPQMYICPKAAVCGSECPFKKAHMHITDDCGLYRSCPACILYVPEAKEYNIHRNCVRMGDGRLYDIPMTRKQAMELGILNKQRNAKR